MRDYLEFDTAPTEESCVQVKRDDDSYYDEMRAEAVRLVKLLEKKFVNMPDDCYFGIKRQDLDFGTYLMVCVFYDSDDEEQVKFMNFVERHFPRTWDDDEERDFRKPKTAIL